MVENIKYCPNVYASELSTGTYERIFEKKTLSNIFVRHLFVTKLLKSCSTELSKSRAF